MQFDRRAGKNESKKQFEIRKGTKGTRQQGTYDYVFGGPERTQVGLRPGNPNTYISSAEYFESKRYLGKNEI